MANVLSLVSESPVPSSREQVLIKLTCMLPLCLNMLLLLVAVLPLKQHILHHFAAFAVYIIGTYSTFLLWFTWCAYRMKMRVSETTWNICELALLNKKNKQNHQPPTTSFHSNTHAHTHTNSAATGTTDKTKCCRKDRNWARENWRYHYLARAHRRDIQTELLSAQLKLREWDRPVNVNENNIAQTHWVDRTKR